MTANFSDTNIKEWAIALHKQPEIIAKVMEILPFTAQDLIKISKDLYRRPLSNDMIQKCMSVDACVKLQSDTYRRLAMLFTHLEIGVELQDGEYQPKLPVSLQQAADLSRLDRHQKTYADTRGVQIRISRSQMDAITQYCKRHRLSRNNLICEIIEVGFHNVTGRSLPGAIAQDPVKDLYQAGFGLITEPQMAPAASPKTGLVTDKQTSNSQPMGLVCE
jgi:hypothetical protein